MLGLHRLEHDLITNAGWVTFLDAFRSDGAVSPGRAKGVNGKTKPEGTLTEQADEASDFSHVYHTTLVAVMAGTVLLNRSRFHVSTAADSLKNSERLVE